MTKLLMPIGYKIITRKLDDGSDNWTIDYHEYFDPNKITMEQMEENAAFIRKALINAIFDPADYSIVFRHVGAKGLILSMIASEFIAASDIGSITIRELLVQSGVNYALDVIPKEEP